jgi:tetratricopeptide (TPR) repeat protein
MRALLHIAFTQALLAGILLVPSVANPAQDATLETLYKQARAAESGGDLKTATEKYEQIVSLRPELGEAYADLGRLYYQQHELEQAARSLKKAIELKPCLAGPYFFLGLMAFNSRRYDQALRYLKEAQALDRSETVTAFYLGYTEYALHNYLAAVQDFQKVAQLQQNNQNVWYYLSMSYGEAAKNYYKLLQQKFPESFYTHLARGHAYEAQRKWADAKKEYGLALDRRPQNARLRQRLAWVKENAAGKHAGPPPPITQVSQDGLIDGSLQVLYAPPEVSNVRGELRQYESLIESDNSAPSAERIYSLGENCQIVSYLTSLRVIEVAPESYRAHELKAQFYAAVGQPIEAIKEYQAAAKIRPDLPDVRFEIGNIYWRRSDLEKALPYLQGELSIQPDYPPALYEVGDIFFAKGKLQTAAQYLVKALEFEPGMVAAHLELERIYTSTGRYSQSVAELKTVLKLDPTDPAPHYRMAMLLRKMGKQAQAQQELQIYLQSKMGVNRPGTPAAGQRGKPSTAGLRASQADLNK